MINSIKFYYEIVKGMPNRFYSIERPRKKESLPKVISLEEVKGIILNTNNIKHKCIVSLLYSAGLRRSELLNLTLQDIDSKRMAILVKNSKGGKDRLTILDRKSTRLNSSHVRSSYAVFCLKKKWKASTSGPPSGSNFGRKG